MCKMKGSAGIALYLSIVSFNFSDSLTCTYVPIIYKAIRCGHKYIKRKRCTKTNCGHVCRCQLTNKRNKQKKAVSNVTKYDMGATTLTCPGHTALKLA